MAVISLDDEIDIDNEVEVNIPSYLLTVYLLDKDIDRFLPVCHVAQSGVASSSLPMIETCLS